MAANTSYRRFYLKYQEFILPFGLIVVALVLFVLFVIPAAQRTLSMFQDAKDIEDQLAALNQKLSVLDQLDEATLQKQLLSATQAVPIDKSLPTVLATIEGIGAQSQVTVKEVEMQNPGAIASTTAAPEAQTQAEHLLGMSLLPFKVSFTGTFAQVQSFLQLSTQVKRFVRAKSFSLDFTPTGDQLTTQVAFDTFYAPLPKAALSGDLHALTPPEQSLLIKLDSIPNIGSQVIVDSNTPDVLGPPKSNPFSE